MTRRLSCTVCVLAAALAGQLACAHPAAPAAIASNARAAPDPAPLSSGREPDGVFLDLTSARPPLHETARAGGVFGLSLPLSRDDALSLVHAYFRAFVGGDPSAFAPLFAHDVRLLDREQTDATKLVERIGKRLRSVDYSRLSADKVAAYDDVRVVPYDVAPESLRMIDAMREGDVLLQIPMKIEHVGVMRVFGPEVVLVLRRADSDGPWRIVAVREDEAPWGS